MEDSEEIKALRAKLAEAQATAAEAQATAAKAVAKEQATEKLNDGTFWTPLEELYKPTPAPFKNGYKAICLRMADEEWKRPQDYQHIVNDLKAQMEESNEVDDISLHSASTKNSERSAVSSERNTDRADQNLSSTYQSPVW